MTEPCANGIPFADSIPNTADAALAFAVRHWRFGGLEPTGGSAWPWRVRWVGAGGGLKHHEGTLDEVVEWAAAAMRDAGAFDERWDAMRGAR